MKKLVLALLLGLLTVALLWFAAVAWLIPASAPELDRAASMPRVGESTTLPAPEAAPAPLIEPPPVEPPLVELPLGPADAVEQREARAQDLRATLPPERLCLLRVRAVLPAGTPADDETEILVLAGGHARRDLDREFARLEAGTPLPDWLVARVAPDADGETELALERRAEPVAVLLRGRFVHSPAAPDVDVAGSAAEATLAAELGACVRGRLVAPADATEAERDLAKTEIALLSDPLEQQGVQTEAPAQAGVARDSEAAASGAFEFRGVPPRKGLTLSGSPTRLAAFRAALDPLVAGRTAIVDIALARGATVSGRVVDDAGAPVEGAEVKARGEAVILGFGGRELRECRSRVDGTFTLEAVAAGSVLLDVAKEGYLDATKSLELAEGGRADDVVLRLASGARIAGHVRRPDGTPCAGARVDVSFDQANLMGLGALNARFGAEGHGKSDEQGAFSVSGLGKGPFTVKASAGPAAEAGADAPRWTARLDGVKPDTLDALLVLLPPSDIAGRVEDDLGAPVDACTVVLAAKPRNAYIPSEERHNIEVHDAEGKFGFAGLSAGTYTALARHASGTASASVEFALPREPGAAELVLILPRPALVTGRVLLPDGSPAAGANVGRQFSLADLAGGQLPGSGPSCTTDADGNFTLAGLPMGGLLLQATKAGFAPSEGVPVALAPAVELADVVLALRAGGTITGEVYDEQGKPKAGARVLAQMPDMKYGQKFASTDSAGKFELAHVAPGQWQVMTFGEGPRSGDDEGAAMADFMKNLKFAMATVVDGESVHVVLGALPRNPVHVRGRITSAKAGVPRAMVSFMRSAGDPESGKGSGKAGAPAAGALSGLKLGSSDDDGVFEIDLEDGGDYLITVQKLTDKGGQQTVEFSRTIPPGPEHSLELELPVGAIAGRVVDAAGDPVPGARISLGVDGAVRGGTLTGGRFSEVQTDERGDYLLEWLAPGRYTVSAGGEPFPGLGGEREPLAREVRDGVAVAEGERVRIDFRLRTACVLRGKVVDAAGRPSGQASIFVRDEAGRPIDRFTMTTTDGGGAFRQKGLGAGRYTVSARTDRLVSDEVSVVLSEGEEAEVLLRLEEGTVLVVTLTGADGEPLEAACRVLDSKGRQVNGVFSLADVMKVMSEGGFDAKHQRIGPLPRGKYTVEATAPDGTVTTKSVTLLGQTERQLTLKLGD